MSDTSLQSQPWRAEADRVMQLPVQQFGRVAVLLGGKSAERDISLMSGQAVLSALVSHGIDAFAFDPAHRPLAELVSEGVDLVFICLHGRFGEDGSVQGVLEQLGIPYTGSGVLASALAMDKVLTKKVWFSEGLHTPEFVVLDQVPTDDREVAQLGYPMIVKAPCEGSTIGIFRVNSHEQLVHAWKDVASLDHAVMAERLIQGRELTVTA